MNKVLSTFTLPFMNQLTHPFLFLLSLSILLPAASTSSQEKALGLFEKQGDIGAVGKPGSVEYNAAQKSYLVTGGGETMWFSNDAFHFIWKQASGNISLAADIRWIGTGGNPHRKACLLIRQTLDPDSPYVDAVVHGNGLTSIQACGFFPPKLKHHWHRSRQARKANS